MQPHYAFTNKSMRTRSRAERSHRIFTHVVTAANVIAGSPPLDAMKMTNVAIRNRHICARTVPTRPNSVVIWACMCVNTMPISQNWKVDANDAHFNYIFCNPFTKTHATNKNQSVYFYIAALLTLCKVYNIRLIICQPCNNS